MASHVSTCMPINGRQMRRGREEEKGKAKEKEKGEKGKKEREREGKKERKRNLHSDCRNSLDQEVKSEGFTPRGMDSSKFGLFSTLRAVWLCL